MRNPKKSHDLILQNEETVKKSQKHETNLQKNSTFYFQVGLIVCLLAAYGLLEMKFETTTPSTSEVLYLDDDFETYVPEFKPEVTVVDEPKQQQTVKEPTSFEEVPNDTPEIFVDVPIEPTVQVTKSPNFEKNPLAKKPDDDVLVRFEAIEHVPVYPGCENKKTNEEKRKCMSDKITQLIQKKFNTGLGSELGLHGKQVIRTQFKIDKTGRVNNIQVRATHPELEKEAERVINIIPEMTPGKQRDKSVGVIYTLPIVFQVQD